MAADRKLGDVATKHLFENDKVRVWEMELDPGQSSDVHEHKLDYLLIQLEGDVAPGNVIFIERGGIETAKNTGQRRYREILVELKD